tara:strand:+ start:86910 stop:87296 length:387 start_codon:yes stop_codon:yes gene_type:complete
MTIQFSEVIRQGGGNIPLGVLDPNVLGSPASIGAAGISTDGSLWVKTGTGNYEWSPTTTIPQYANDAALQALKTAGRADYTEFKVYVPTRGVEIWRLEPISVDLNGANELEPLDYDVGTNNRKLRIRL